MGSIQEGAPKRQIPSLPKQDENDKSSPPSLPEQDKYTNRLALLGGPPLRTKIVVRRRQRKRMSASEWSPPKDNGVTTNRMTELPVESLD